MLERIEVISNQGALLNLPLEDLDHGFLLENVEGLDPVKATITSSSFAQLDGSQYQSSRREERNIKLTISLVPDFSANESVRDLRRRLYAYFMSKAAVDLRFYDTDMMALMPAMAPMRTTTAATPLTSWPVSMLPSLLTAKEIKYIAPARRTRLAPALRLPESISANLV